MSRVLARPLDTRTIALSVAGLLAVGTGVLTYSYLASVGHANAPAAQRAILLATRTIPAHATITAEMLTRASRRADAVDPDALVAPVSAIGSATVNEIPAGSVITASKLVHYVAAGLPGRVHVGMRAVSIALDRVKGVSNLIKAGDKVDVIAATPPRSDTLPKAVTIIRGATVLSVGQMTEAGATPVPRRPSLPHRYPRGDAQTGQPHHARRREHDAAPRAALAEGEPAQPAGRKLVLAGTVADAPAPPRRAAPM